MTVERVSQQPGKGVLGLDSLPAALARADIVIILVPMTPATRVMVDARFLGRMRDHALLVNAARGPIVDTSALLAELRSGRLRAALDVTDPEPLPAGHPLWSAPGLLLTPHVAGATNLSSRRVIAIVRDQLARFAAGEPLRNVVGDQGLLARHRQEAGHECERRLRDSCQPRVPRTSARPPSVRACVNISIHGPPAGRRAAAGRAAARARACGDPCGRGTS